MPPTHDNVDTVAAGAVTTFLGTLLTWSEGINAVVDIVSGLTAIAVGILTCIWTYKRIKNMKGDK